LAVNVAVTAVLPVKVTLQGAVPLQAPDQPANVELLFGAAVSVTLVPLVTLVLHVAPQSIPAGLLVTVPAPVPALWTVSWTELGGGGSVGCCGLELCDPHPAPAMHNPKVRNRKGDPDNTERYPRIDCVPDSIDIPQSLRQTIEAGLSIFVHPRC
jgi:hypothetical protein